MTKYHTGGRRRPHEIALLVVAVAAAGFNLRTAITSVPPLFPDMQTTLHLSSAELSLLAATPVICFGVVSAFAAWLNRRYGEEPILLAALRPRGMMVLYGAASGQVPPLDPQRLNSGGSLFLTRPTLVHYIADPAELRWRASEVFSWIAKGELDVRIGGTYPLAEAARAQEDLASRRTTGKLLLLPGL